MKYCNPAKLAAMVIAAILLLGLSAAMADPILRLSSGATTIDVLDNGAYDLNPIAGVVLYSGAVNNWMVNVSTGITQPAQGSALLPYLHLNSINMSVGSGDISISFTETDFEYLGAFEMNLGGTAAPGGTVTYQMFQDPNNAAFGMTNLVGTIGPFGSGAFSGSISGPGLTSDNPLGYSLTQVITINHSAQGIGTTSFDAEATVPEPSALLLLGTGIVGLGIWRFRRS